MVFESCSIIGYGRVGRLFREVLPSAGIHDIQIIQKNDPKTPRGSFVIISTPDNQIHAVVEELAQSGSDFSGKIVVHCSGLIASAILTPLRTLGATIGCLHPIQPVTLETTSFEGSWFDIEGDEAAMGDLEKLAKKFGAQTLHVSPRQKERLHLAAVVASNYLVTLADISTHISEQSGLDKTQTLDALIPLMQSTLKNLESLRPSQALTGPIARGDTDTVAKHIKLLKNDAKLLSMYKNLGLLTLDLTDLEESVKQKLLNLFK